MSTLKRIAITGPESTGKSYLSAQLAEYFNTVWVPEYAREFLNTLNRAYHFDDILSIAKAQIQNENILAEKAKKFLFCDTDLTVCKIWCEFKFQKCHDWINEEFINHKYDLYLLCNNDLPWEYDPQRENANERNELFDMYLSTLQKAKYPIAIISGTGYSRTQNAIDAIKQLF